MFCLPGSCFGAPNYFRVVLTVPHVKIQEACNRIATFCNDHHISDRKIQIRGINHDEQSYIGSFLSKKM